MDAANAIEVKNVTKMFKVYMDKGKTLKERVLFRKRRSYEERKVLDDISFSLKKGEALGLIGENGCGKSTTLKLLTRIMYPDSGTIKMKGRVSSLIELGAGFHPDMSGRQNIYINASIFGLSRKEIDDRLDDIIDFSELREFIDNPVRTYSSGMYMRLAFSVAINVNADILLIDEILTVGDANFQAKCFNWLRELKIQGITIVIVSHDLATIEKFCNSAAWINKGKIVEYGPSSRVVGAYLKYMNDKKIISLMEQEERKKEKLEGKELSENDNKGYMSETEPETEAIVTSTEHKGIEATGVLKEQVDEIEAARASTLDTSSGHYGLGYVAIEAICICNGEGVATDILRGADACSMALYYRVEHPLKEYIFGISIYDAKDNLVYESDTYLDRLRVYHDKMNGIIRYNIDKLMLLSGRYRIKTYVQDINRVPLEVYDNYAGFEVISDDNGSGIMSLEHSWNIL